MSKRQTKIERLAAQREAALVEAQRLAGLLAAAPTDGEGPLAPPAFIADPRLAPALTVWRELAPQLIASGRLQSLDRDMFAALCYWRAEWITAVDDILANGYSFMAKAIAGGSRPWTNPAVERRDTAWDQIVELSSKFGLTPLDRVALNRAANDGLLADPDLFTQRRPGAAKAEPAAKDAASDSWAPLLN